MNDEVRQIYEETFNRIIVGIVLICIGLLFFFNNKNMGKGAAALYKKLYTEKNLTVMFRIATLVLVVGGLLIIFVK